MEKDAVDLRQQFEVLAQNFSQLSEQLSQGNQDIQNYDIFQYKKQIESLGICCIKFQELRNKVFDAASCLPIFLTKTLDEIVALNDINILLQELQEAENERVRKNALQVLDRILAIIKRDRVDFPALQECQQQASELRHTIANDSKCIDWREDIESLALGKHPLAALLELVERRETSAYIDLANLQKVVKESFPKSGEELSVAALMGHLCISEELLRESPAITTAECNKTPSMRELSEVAATSSIEKLPGGVSVQVPSEENVITEDELILPTAIKKASNSEQVSTQTASQKSPEDTGELIGTIEKSTDEFSVSVTECEAKPISLEVVQDSTPVEALPVTSGENHNDTQGDTPQPNELLVQDTDEPNNSLLQGRYQLNHNLNAIDGSESWLGQDEDCSDYLINLQRYPEKQPNEVLRRIWDNQLRTLYRLSSSPGAEESILTLYDAGIDRDCRAFVMVLNSDCNGYETLATAFTNRQDPRWQKCNWLQINQIKKAEVRQQIWQGLRQIATGIELLHRQQVIHRNICAENIYFAENQGPDSWRLGGFEWSVRLGNASHNSPVQSWNTPPEFSDEEAIGYTFDTDWYAFGMLAARCFYKYSEEQDKSSPNEPYDQVLQRLEDNYSNLSSVEVALIQQLITSRPEERLRFSTEIIRELDEIINKLNIGIGIIGGGKKQPLKLAFNPKNEKISDTARQGGFVPNPSKPDEDYNFNNSSHISRLKNFLRENLESAKLYPMRGKTTYVLAGQRITLLIDQFQKQPGQPGTWDIAFAYDPGELRGNEDENFKELRDIPIEVIIISEAKKNPTTNAKSQSWKAFLPQIDEKKALREPLAKFREFLQCTNQLELLMRDAEIFAYRIKDKKIEGTDELIYIEERERDHPVSSFCQIRGGMLEFLQREFDSGRKDCKLFLLTDDNSLTIDGGRQKNEAWEFVRINREQKYAELRRATSDGVPQNPAPESGYLRSWNLFAQIKVIQRRKDAIDRLEDHSYLLQALATPRPMDTKWIPPLDRLDTTGLDRSKKAAIQDILRVRPIYTLQGPPGTGKTTLVAHLLREIIDEDPVAQVLVTAQAHSAVDVLRDKVWNEAFRDVDNAQKPIAVRLGVGDDAEGNVEGTVEQVSRDLLQKTFNQLSEFSSPSAIQQEWSEILEQMLHAQSSASEPALAEFQELVKRGANIAYCTTTAGDLEELANSNQSFDWSIVEEAGKAHGFELALPLQAGHRWMLLGDHKQLPPYRYTDYLKCLTNLDQVVNNLDKLPRRDRSLLDNDWLRNWKDKEAQAKNDFIKYAEHRLTTFEYLFENLRDLAYGQQKITTTESEGAAAGRLSMQYRMHPTIGDLIFRTFYNEDKLYDEENTYNQPVTNDEGNPELRVCHPFIEPGNIKDKAVVWIDIPWYGDEPEYEEEGENKAKPRYTNPFEVEAVKEFLSKLRYDKAPDQALKVAVLSPYAQQVALLRKELDKLELPPKIVRKENLRARKGKNNQPPLVHTVDSFQGNEADIVIISLVRNNHILSEDKFPDGMGFLKEAKRLNVLLSRAEKLLVLVGSWKFFERHLEDINIEDRHNSLWEWKNIFQMLNEGFTSGLALKIPYRQIVKCKEV
ncbi:AAA domain-containing protein [Microcoleus sp. FACHB-68]|uniref:AAA domain-containing protein n=1 Tax=Microcoleus sp. FACHB-68 TaxID=2692826 RepID=UPI001689435D|nr:AAA domain-containing protein [Microcoleus sp. FACHB-68]MBD1939065.1 AAA family ATPase [Microcoleus sp. FACHB-68]